MIHCGRRPISTGDDCTKTPCFSKALNQAADQVSRSGRVVMTISSVSGAGSDASFASTAPPSLPGRGVGIRTSMIRRSENSDSDWLDAISSDQSNERSVMWSSRPLYPSARARARIASAASPIRSGSSPASSQTGDSDFSSVRGS